MGSSVIELVNVRRYYLVGEYLVKALEDVSLTIQRGSFTAIMGPSGSGKSTLMNLIGCLDTPTSGYITIGGELTNGMEEDELAFLRNQKIGFIFQQFNLLGKLTALENVMTPMVYSLVPHKERREKAEAMLEKVGLKERMKHLPSELSGGQKQRVAIARALVNDPDILLADEPTGALDTKTGREVMGLFQELNEEGRTIVFVTHDRKLGLQCPERIFLQDGRIVEEDVTREL